MKHKIITALLILAAAVSVTGCASSAKTSHNGDSKTVQTAKTEASASTGSAVTARLKHMAASAKFKGDYVTSPQYFKMAPDVNAAVLGRSGEGESFLYISNESDKDISISIKLKGATKDKKKTDNATITEPFIGKGTGRIESVTSDEADDIEWDFKHAEDVAVKPVEDDAVKKNSYTEPDISYNLSNAGVTSDKQYFTLDVKNNSKKDASLHGDLYFVLRDSHGAIQGVKKIDGFSKHNTLKAGDINETTFPVRNYEVKTPELVSGAIVYTGYFTGEK